MGSNDLLGKHCSLLSCSLTCRSGRSRPAETGRHLNSLWHEGGLSSYSPGGGTILRQQTVVNNELEPNNRLGEANVVAYGSTVSGKISKDDPTDHFIFNV